MGPHLLGDGALLQGVIAQDISVPAGATVTAADTVFWPTSLAPELPSLTGAGEVRLTDGAVMGGGVGGQVTVRVPAGEAAVVTETLEEQARLVVEGAATTPHGNLAVLDDAVLEVTHGGVWDTSDDGSSQAPRRSGPLGRVVVDEGGEVLGGGPTGSLVMGDLANHGTVRADGSLTVLGALTTNGAGAVVEVGADTVLETTGRFRNAGTVTLDATARLVTGSRFTQTAAGALQVAVSRAAAGRVVAGGLRDLAGTLVLSPRRATVATASGRAVRLVTSEGRATRGDAFDVVRAPRRSGSDGAGDLRRGPGVVPDRRVVRHEEPHPADELGRFVTCYPVGTAAWGGLGTTTGVFAMRTALGSSLLLLALSGLVAVPATADAATVCDAPDTTWVGPASADGDRSWTVASNWSNGVPAHDQCGVHPGRHQRRPRGDNRYVGHRRRGRRLGRGGRRHRRFADGDRAVGRRAVARVGWPGRAGRDERPPQVVARAGLRRPRCHRSGHTRRGRGHRRLRGSARGRRAGVVHRRAGAR